MKNLILTGTAATAAFRMPSCATLVFAEVRPSKVRDAHAGAAVRHPGSHSWKRLRSTTD